jgi:hemoglobin/transferrin/lactoferrin receptor protein
LSPTNSLPVFETNTAKYSQVLTALKEIHHESISNDDIYNSNASSGAELLLLTDGVTIQKSQGGGGSPIIRGFEANRVLLMIDGVRMNNAIYRSGHIQNSLTVDPFVVENCDVIYGSSAVSYGSDAIGGVIHYKTVDPKLSESNKTVTRSTNYFNRLSSGSEEITHHFNFNIGIKKWASFSSATYKQYGDIKMGENRSHGFNDWGKVYHSIINSNNTDSVFANTNPSLQKGLGYEQVDLIQKLLYQPTKNLSFMFNSQLSSSSNISRFDQLNNIGINGPQFSQWEYGPQKRWMNSLKIKYSHPKKNV